MITLTQLEARSLPATVIPAGDPAGNYTVTFGDLNDPGIVGFVGDSITLSVTTTYSDGTVSATPWYSGIKTITVYRPNPEITDPEDDIDDEFVLTQTIYVDDKPPGEAVKGRVKGQDVVHPVIMEGVVSHSSKVSGKSGRR